MPLRAGEGAGPYKKEIRYMSKKPQYDPEEIRYPEQKIVESPLVPEMELSLIHI